MQGGRQFLVDVMTLLHTHCIILTASVFLIIIGLNYGLNIGSHFITVIDSHTVSNLGSSLGSIYGTNRF